MARKRRHPDSLSDRPTKLAKSSNGATSKSSDALPTVHHAVLSNFYPKVCTLKDYFIKHLPATSRVRRRTLSAVAMADPNCILNSCLVGVSTDPSIALAETRKLEFATFTQSPHRATGACTSRSQRYCIDEIVDFVIWFLFRHCPKGWGRPDHILCRGFQRDGDTAVEATTFLPGIIRHAPNDSLNILKSGPWTDIPPLLGADAEAIFSSLLLDCGIFTKVQVGHNNYYQLSGVPISELPQLRPVARPESSQLTKRDGQISRPTSVCFLRNRMFYARPSLNRVGKIKFGLHYTHVLQRIPAAHRVAHTVHLLKYIFPRQFGLRNMFVSRSDSAETKRKHTDFTFREGEINNASQHPPTWVPRRLRGGAIQLAQRIRANHRSCSYSQLLRHYCPLVSLHQHPTRVMQENPFSTHHFTSGWSNPANYLPKENSCDVSFLASSTPLGNVSAFCRSAIAALLPSDAFGQGPDGQHNHEVLMKNIDIFIKMSRYERVTLHQMVQDIRMRCINWLSRPETCSRRMARSDTAKRVEILNEFVYYLFDSLLIPLIRAHFYVTEGSTQRNRIHFFRHDVWRKLSEPSLATLKLNMYASVEPGQARQTLRSSALGYSHVRLLPKDEGSRPIINLGRRPTRAASGNRTPGSSINTQLGPLFGVLKCERERHSALLGSALFSVGDMHGKLARFKNIHAIGAQLYFAKVDVKSCFDTIPQDHLLQVISTLLTESSYRRSDHVEFASRDNSLPQTGQGVIRKFVSSTRPAHSHDASSGMALSDLAAGKRHVVFVDTDRHRVLTRTSLCELLKNHVSHNLVKIGKKYMEQVNGIPQGSVLSSILCNYFYGDFERNELGFLDSSSCLLVRLIDDFLLISTDVLLAQRFLEVMACGNKDYGIEVNPHKSLVNFDMTLQGQPVPRVQGKDFFPYCGIGIDMTTLEVKKDRERKDPFICNAVTVERSSRPGIQLVKKTMASLKLQMHIMLLDLTLNSRRQVVTTLLSNFTEVAMKLHQYMARLPPRRRPSQAFVISLVEELVLLGSRTCWARNHNNKDNEQIESINRVQMSWIAASAFRSVLRRKQSQYPEVLHWLGALEESTQSSMKLGLATLRQLLVETQELFRSYIY